MSLHCNKITTPFIKFNKARNAPSRAESKRSKSLTPKK